MTEPFPIDWPTREWKPHIWWKGFCWWCGSREGFKGWGSTPEKAYRNWVFGHLTARGKAS